MTVSMTRGSGNIFLDAGFPPEEAAQLHIRSKMMILIEKIIKERSLTQKEAAAVLGVTQPRVSDIVRGRMERFSVDTLIEMLTRLGVEVAFTAKRRRSKSA